MSPNTQVALIALVLFFAVASVSIFWPRLAGLEAHRKGRSLSSHLQSFRWTWPMAMSLMHRISGGALGLVTIFLLASGCSAWAGHGASSARPSVLRSCLSTPWL